MSIKNPTLVHFRHFRSLLTKENRESSIVYRGALGTISTLVERALQIHPLLQNKANFRKSQVNVNIVSTRDYENWTLGERGKNKAKTKPIQSQYEPKTNPIQSQTNPISIAKKCCSPAFYCGTRKNHYVI
jgi:hypothetical protein